jgi:hypothetical protein
LPSPNGHTQRLFPTACERNGETFGRWWFAQTGRAGWTGDLVTAAKSDREFPRNGDPEAVRKRLRDTMAGGDMFEAVDNAEGEWMSEAGATD